MSENDSWKPLAVTPGEYGVRPGAAGLVEVLHLLDDLDDVLTRHKAIEFRDFRIAEDELDEVLAPMLPNRLAYVYGNSPRSKVGRNVYTSTEYPAQFDISLHSELSYAHRWPARLAFHCATPARTGGQTPVADTAGWLANLPAEVRSAFAGGIRYTQNLHGGRGFGKSWQATFETDDRSAVEEYLAGAGASWTWTTGDGLRVSHVRPSTVRHPRVPGVDVWFNQSDQWHVSGMGADGAALAEMLSPAELPMNVEFADGEPIPAAYIAEIRRAGWAAAVDVDWREGDLLLVDNVLVAHGRRAFVGDRRVLVAMSD